MALSQTGLKQRKKIISFLCYHVLLNTVANGRIWMETMCCFFHVQPALLDKWGSENWEQVQGESEL